MVGYSQNYNYDVNGDGEVTAADITAIYDYLLGNVPVVTMYNVNGVLFKMVQVDGGTFTMGDTSDPAVDGEYDIDERPSHQVTLNTFLIGQTEVTQELWEAVM
ncbi:MAG: SUMF1/EgtB/PvdO family nonheme iron enzyme [Muribaculaceae bacterium]|nr:SUMF1/EgtB/PvdO family nonheme iron enzyme [Muribaculaceae bacterium]